MSTTALDHLLHSRPADTLAGLAIVSGTLSALWGQSFELEPLRPVATVFALDPGVLPIGFFYGVAMGLGIAAWTRKPWAGIAVLVTTIYAWSAAVHTAIRVESNTGEDTYLIAASMCAGAVGAGLTHLGCALFAVDLRRPWWRLALTCAVGAAFGMFFYLGERKIVDERVLFFVWQPAVAFAIGLGLPRQARAA